MQYSCDDIQRILASPIDAQFDHNAFVMHLESCASCQQLGILEPVAEKALGSLLPSPAPETIALNIMQSIQEQVRITSPITSAKKVVAVLLGAIYFVIAAISLANGKAIINAIVTSFYELKHLSGLIASLGINREALSSNINKASFSPMILTGLMGISILVWVYSILRFRDTN